MTFLSTSNKLINRVIPVSGVILATALVLSCEDSVFPTDIGEPPFRIADAAHAGHNQDFFFLPPLVPDPSGHLAFDLEGFDGRQAAEVQICALVNGACDTSPAQGFPLTYSMTDGPGSEMVRVSVEDEHYVVNWHTDQFALDTSVTYRIGVSVAGTELGYADMDLVASGKELKNVDTDEYIGLKDGRTLPVKFRIEHGAVYVVDASGGTVEAAEGAVTLDLPADAVDGPVGLTVVPTSEYPSDPSMVPGTAYDFGPDDLRFNQPVMFTIVYDESLLDGKDETSLRIHKLVGNAWEVVPDGEVDPEGNTASAPIHGFSTYVIAARPLVPVPSDVQIFFGSTRLGDYDVYSVAPGSGASPLIVYEGARDGHPVLSPDGQWLAFVSDRDGDLDVYVANVSDWIAQKVTDNAVDERNPDWSPDGSKLAFQSLQDGNWDICVINADGSEFTNLTSTSADDDMEPDWSPEGGRIAFSTNRDGNRELYVINLSDGALERITFTDYPERDPDWSPDAMYLAYDAWQHGQWDVLKYSLHADYPMLLTHPSFGGGFEPVWSPDGQHITFVSLRDGNWEIYVMNADGSGQTRLTDDPANDARPAWGVLSVGQFTTLLTLVNDPFFKALILRLPTLTAENIDAAIDQAVGAMIRNDPDGVRAGFTAAKSHVTDGEPATAAERAFLEFMLDYGLTRVN